MTAPAASTSTNASNAASESPAAGNRRRQATLVVLLLVLGVLVVAMIVSRINTRLRLTKPAGFAEVNASERSQRFVQKLISPTGTVIAVRRFDNPDEKTGLDYWGQALELEKTQKDGMVLVARDELTTTKGQSGLLFDFEVGERPGHIRYLIALFVLGDSIYTVEAGGDPDAITTSRDAIVATMKTLGE